MRASSCLSVCERNFRPHCRLDPNCEVDELPSGEGCLRALKNIKAGDFLSVAPSDDEDEDEDEDDDDDDDDEDDDDDDDEDDEDEEEDEDEEDCEPAQSNPPKRAKR